MRIDAHQHFWRIAARDGEWPPADLAAIHRDFEPEHLEPLLGEASVDGTVLVQTMARASDTSYMLGLADRHGFVKGVVGWTDLKAPDAPAAVAALARHPKLKGVRPMLQDIADDAWIADPKLAAAVEAMVEHDLALDALVLPRHLCHLLAFAERHSRLRIVIDHGAKPPIAEGRFTGWRRAMTPLAALGNVSCKLSGLLTEAAGQRPEAVRPYAETILELFGPSRVIWGSDWPVLRLACDYRVWLDQCLAMVPTEHHAAVFGTNAIQFYGLDDMTLATPERRPPC